MLYILSITSPIFIVILFGYCLTRAGMFDKAGIKVIGTFTVNIAVPILLFKGISQKHISEIINLIHVLGYLLGSLLVLVIIYLWSLKVMKQSHITSTFSSLGASCPNTMLIGYPILLLTFPAEAETILAINLIIENLIILPIILIMAEQKNNGDKPRMIILKTCKQLLKNPIIIALALGMAVSLSGILLPKVVVSIVDIISASTLALSLIFIGGSLFGLSVKNLGGRILSITLGKLMLHPLLVFLSILLFQYFNIGTIDTHLIAAAVLAASIPIFGIYPILAQKYGEDATASAALFMSVIVSFFTLSALLFLMKPLIT